MACKHLRRQVGKLIHPLNTLRLADFSGREPGQDPGRSFILVGPFLPRPWPRAVEGEVRAYGDMFLADQIKHIGDGIDHIHHRRLIARREARRKQRHTNHPTIVRAALE